LTITQQWEQLSLKKEYISQGERITFPKVMVRSISPSKEKKLFHLYWWFLLNETYNRLLKRPVPISLLESKNWKMFLFCRDVSFRQKRRWDGNFIQFFAKFELHRNHFQLSSDLTEARVLRSSQSTIFLFLHCQNLIKNFPDLSLSLKDSSI